MPKNSLTSPRAVLCFLFCIAAIAACSCSRDQRVTQVSPTVFSDDEWLARTRAWKQRHVFGLAPTTAPSFYESIRTDRLAQLDKQVSEHLSSGYAPVEIDHVGTTVSALTICIALLDVVERGRPAPADTLLALRDDREWVRRAAARALSTIYNVGLDTTTVPEHDEFTRDQMAKLWEALVRESGATH